MPDSTRPNNWPAPTAEANPTYFAAGHGEHYVTIHGIERRYWTPLEARQALGRSGFMQHPTTREIIPDSPPPVVKPAKAKRTNAALAFVAAREEQAQAAAFAEARTMRAMRRSGGNPTVHTAACHARVARQWNGDYRNLPRSPTPGCQGCDAGKRAR
jgi:hypothetical protein